MACIRKALALCLTLLLAFGLAAGAQAAPPAAAPAPAAPAVGSDAWWQAPANVFASRRDVAAMHIAYMEEMSQPIPFTVRTGAEFKAHQEALRAKFLACAGLAPLPQRPPLDLTYSAPLDHEWCTVRRVNYQLWPGVYATGLLYMPKTLPERPAPAILCPHGHWADGNAHPIVQTRCLVLARMGYVVFSTSQNHYEDLPWGISHQTLMIWSNVRGLDLLESLGEVDKARLGCTGCSGGGLQTQMLLAADTRLKAAAIVGMTCEYREKIFPAANHCACNHFPNIMRHTEGPELACLGLPAAVQFLTMKDWTANFEKNNYPTIKAIFDGNGLKDHTDCYFEPTEHTYDKPKRERMYGWMEKHLRGKEFKPVPEPEVKTFPVKTILALKADSPGNKGFGQISKIYAEQFRPAATKLAARADWEAWRKDKLAAMDDLLGKPLPRSSAAAKAVATETRDGLTIEKVLVPSEGPVAVPVLVLRPANAKGKLPIVIYCDGRGKAALLADVGDNSASAAAKRGAMVVLADPRFAGELQLASIAKLAAELRKYKACSPLGELAPTAIEGAWQRHAILWGRPFPAMAATDLRAVIDYAAARSDADAGNIRLVAYGNLAAAAMFCAAADGRVTSLWLDFQGKSFEKRTLPLVPFVLRHGNVTTWAGLLADRRADLAGLSKDAGDPAWLQEAFRAAGNEKGLALSK